MLKMLWVPGHGQGDPGAIGNGKKEFERVRVFGVYFKEELEKYKNVVLDLYDKNTSLSGSKDLFQRGNIATVGKDYVQVFEGHLNSASASALGVEVLLNGEPDTVDRKVLSALSKHFVNRGFKDGSMFYNPSHVTVPYRLIEICFISNSGDMDKLNSKMREIARDLAKGVASAYNLELKPAQKQEVKFLNIEYVACTDAQLEESDKKYKRIAYTDPSLPKRYVSYQSDIGKEQNAGKGIKRFTDDNVSEFSGKYLRDRPEWIITTYVGKVPKGEWTVTVHRLDNGETVWYKKNK